MASTSGQSVRNDARASLLLNLVHAEGSGAHHYLESAELCQVNLRLVTLPIPSIFFARSTVVIPALLISRRCALRMIARAVGLSRRSMALLLNAVSLRNLLLPLARSQAHRDKRKANLLLGINAMHLICSQSQTVMAVRLALRSHS